jgi:hypothetical protein
MPKNPKIPTTSKGLNVNPKMLTTLEALQLRRQLAKRLNQRMRRLKAKGFDSEVGGAYADYQDLLARFFPGRSTIPENLDNEKYKGLPRTQVKAIQKVLKEKSSTVQGWHEIIDQRQKTLSREYGINFKSKEEMKLFFKSEVWKWMQLFYDSKQTMRIISHKLDTSTVKKIIEDLEQFRERTDEEMADVIAKRLGFSGESEALKYRPY